MFRTLRFILSHPLNKDRKLETFTRYLQWQISARLFPVPHIVPFVGDSVLVMEKGMTGATGNWYCGLHEVEDMAFVLHMLRENELFVDVGANVGSYTVLASGAVGAKTKCFEPASDTYRKLTRNVFANQIQDRVDCHNIGLGAREEILNFTAGHDTTNHIVSEPAEGDTEEIQVRRLDAVLNGEVPVLIKMDVEGWEAEVLAGMPETLANPALVAIVAETNDSASRYGKSEKLSISETMQVHGFQPFSYDPFSRDLTHGGTTQNTIFVRNVEFVRGRLKSSRAYSLVNGQI